MANYLSQYLEKEMKQRQKLTAFCYDKRGRLISKGSNSYVRTHPLQKYFAKKTGFEGREVLHAEISAILKAKGKIIHHIHVVRIGRDGKEALAKPCPICMEAISAFGIKKVSWSV